MSCGPATLHTEQTSWHTWDMGVGPGEGPERPIMNVFFGRLVGCLATSVHQLHCASYVGCGGCGLAQQRDPEVVVTYQAIV